MASHIFEVEVHIFDTDCFGVMWHGAYVKWLEMGRVKLFQSVGIEMSKPTDPEPLVYPVIEQQFKFRSPARMLDVLLLKSEVRVEGRRLVFAQSFTNKDTGKLVMSAETVCVVLDGNWKPLRHIPEHISDCLNVSAS